MKLKIEDMEMSGRLKGCLLRHGIVFLEEIYAYTDEDYFKVRNIGRKCIQEAHDLVKQYQNQS